MIFYLASSDYSIQTIDRYSAANLHQIVSTHYDLDLTIDFKTKTLEGFVVHTFRSTVEGNTRIVLDTRDIIITNVTNANTNKNYPYSIHPFYYITDADNSQLVIIVDHPMKYDEIVKIKIFYKTSPDATAISWVDEQQTFGKKNPFMFTQCEAIQCRSIIPIQDSPSIKSTFNAVLRIDKKYTALASAVLMKNTTEGDKNIFEFKQAIPVPSYLLALVAGNIASKKVGKRAVVYAEPEILEKSAKELVDMDAYINIIEGVLTPYVWGIYGVIIMPPSFPYGGMENPYLTFVSPSIIVGDKSSAYVVAHEICHSWFGNQITGKNWSHFWLNEGFTRYSERLIVRELYGEERYKSQVAIGVNDLEDLMIKFKSCPQCTILFPNVYRDGPDNIMTNVAYERGFLFLKYLERKVGTEVFYGFLRTYLATMSFKSADVWEMKEIFEKHVRAVLKGKAEEILKSIEWNHWLFEPGMPRYDENFTDPKIAQAEELAKSYMHGIAVPDANRTYWGFSLDLKVIFVRKLIESINNVTKTIAETIEKDLEIIMREVNPEVIVLWMRIMITSGSAMADARAGSYLGSVGRQKLVVPVYEAYAIRNLALGRKYFNIHKDFYHPIARNRIKNVLKL